MISSRSSVSLDTSDSSGASGALDDRHATHAATLRHHPLAGTLMRSRSSPAAWHAVQCDEHSLIGRVEIQPRRGIVTFMAAPEHVPRVPGRQQEIQHAITDAIAMSGEVQVTLHQNHAEDAAWSSGTNRGAGGESEADIDFYHTLGLPLRSGRRVNHYHLEFPDRLDAATLRHILNRLVARPVGDRAVLSAQDAQRILGLLNARAEAAGEDLRARMPASGTDVGRYAALRTQQRDSLQAKYLELCEMNRQQAMARREDLRSPRTGFVNRDQRGTRRSAVEASCLQSRDTQDAANLALGSAPARLGGMAQEPMGVIRLASLRHGLRALLKRFPGEVFVKRGAEAAIAHVDSALRQAVGKSRQDIPGARL